MVHHRLNTGHDLAPELNPITDTAVETSLHFTRENILHALFTAPDSHRIALERTLPRLDAGALVPRGMRTRLRRNDPRDLAGFLPHVRVRRRKGHQSVTDHAPFTYRMDAIAHRHYREDIAGINRSRTGDFRTFLSGRSSKTACRG